MTAFAAVVRAIARSRSPASLGLRTALAHFWFALNFFLAIPALLLHLSGAGWRPPPGGFAALGLAIIVLAHVALIFPLVVFVRVGRGTQAPLDPPRELVVQGQYRWVRNPMYLLYVGIVLGEALIYRSLPLLVYALVFWAATHAYVVGVEEKAMQRRFGAAYSEYCQRVGRWFPRLRTPG